MADLVISYARLVQQNEAAGIGYFDSTASDDMVSGNYARLVPASGKAALGNATTAPELGNMGGMVVGADALTGRSVHVVLDGVIDVGDALDALDFDDLVYVSNTDGAFADAAGTVSQVVGVVVPGWAFGSTADKLLRFYGNKP